MISNQILQNTVEGLKSIARVELCVMDVDGKSVATTADEMEQCGKPAAEFAKSQADSQEIQGYQYFKIFDEQQIEYILIAGGIGEDVYIALHELAAAHLLGALGSKHIPYLQCFERAWEGVPIRSIIAAERHRQIITQPYAR